MERLHALSKKKLAIVCLLAGILIGIIGYIGYRMATLRSANVHHHANFALYIDGQRDEFKSFTFYEEVQACVDNGANNPKSRVHMHNQDPDLVHVHDGGATWGHFMANLGYSLSDQAVQTDKGIFTDGETKKLRFMLNGKEVESVANRVIESEDVLLIDYGETTDDQLKQRYDGIPTDAGEFNGKYDPGNCSGNEELTFTKRLKSALGIVDAAAPGGHSH